MVRWLACFVALRKSDGYCDFDWRRKENMCCKVEFAPDFMEKTVVTEESYSYPGDPTTYVLVGDVRDLSDPDKEKLYTAEDLAGARGPFDPARKYIRRLAEKYKVFQDKKVIPNRPKSMFAANVFQCQILACKTFEAC